MIKEWNCPGCGTLLNEHAECAHSDDAEPDDVSVCLYCLRPAVFYRAEDGDLNVREPTEAERIDIEADPAFIEAVAFCKQFKQRQENKEDWH